MGYTLTFKEHTIELPKYSLGIADKLEKQETINASAVKLKDKLKAMYELCEELVGKEKLVDIVGKFTEIDPNDLNILYLQINSTYNKPVIDYNAEVMEDRLKDSQISNIVELVNAMTQAEKLSKK